MFFLIAGPCVIESEEMALSIAQTMKEITDRLGIPYIFKASFDKANRTSLTGFRGPGLEEGIRILRDVKSKVGVPICTDIHESYQADPVSEIADIIQIPAFLCRQTDLLVAAARTGKWVNIKKAQFLAPWDMEYCIHKVVESGNDNVMVSERGSIFGYNTLVVDMTGLRVLKGFGYPVVFDATHSVQKPGGKGSCSGGSREYVEYLAKAALATGADGIFMEIHPDPDHAKSDGPNMVPLDKVEMLLKKLQKVYLAVHSEEAEHELH